MRIKENEETTEIELYDQELSIEENLETGEKYIVIKADWDSIVTVEGRKVVPDRHSKILTIPRKVDETNPLLDFALFEANGLTPFMLRDLNTENYNPNFFDCSERVLFEKLLLMHRYFKNKGLNEFYYSYDRIFQELGIKKSRAQSIVKKFTELGILTRTIKRGFVNNRPSQIGYFTLHPERIIELIPQIYLDTTFEKWNDEVAYNVKDLNSFFKAFLGIKDNPSHEAKVLKSMGLIT